jgi:hypothetical protein
MRLDPGVPRAQFAPSLAVPQRSEFARVDFGITRDARVGPVGRGVTALQLGVPPRHTMSRDVEVPEGRADLAEGEESRAHVVHEARERGLFRPHGSAGMVRMRLEHENAAALLGQRARGH